MIESKNKEKTINILQIKSQTIFKILLPNLLVNIDYNYNIHL